MLQAFSTSTAPYGVADFNASRNIQLILVTSSIVGGNSLLSLAADNPGISSFSTSILSGIRNFCRKPIMERVKFD